MMSKNLYINIVLHVLFIVSLSMVMLYSYFQMERIWIIPVFAFIIFIEMVTFINYLNKTNRRLSYFIDSIRNEDTSLQFPKDIHNKPVLDLYKSLGFLSESIRKKTIEIGYNEQLLKTLIEYSSTGFITIDEKGNFEVLNHHARKFLGIEHTSNLIRLKQQDPGLYHIVDSLLPGETKIHRINREDLFMELSISVSEIKYYDKRFKIVSLQNITRELEEQELASWHKLFRVITHEIMNSIAPITSLSETMLKLYGKNGHSKTPDEITEKTIENTVTGLKVIEDMSKGLMNFVQNYRQLSRVPTPRMARIDMKTWLTNLKMIITEMIKDKDIKLIIKLSNECISIQGDEKLLNQVMINLVSNSIDAMDDLTNKELCIRAYHSNEGRTIISVTDTGEGISKDETERAFVPFYTTKEKGNGIGLSLSKQIIQLHQGSIMLQSEENKGTRVTILL